MIRKLILNADDYGLCAHTSSAVEELIEAGRLRDVSVLANGELWESSASFLKRRPWISGGAHLNVVEGYPVSRTSQMRWLTSADGAFAGLRVLLARCSQHPLAVANAVEIEWRAQLERLRKAGLSFSHADSHQHLHAFPPFWRCAIKLCREYGIPSLRLPRERNRLPLRRAGAWALGASLGVSARLTSSHGISHNDHFLGFKRAGVYGLTELLADLRVSPPGVTEVALHPSIKDGAPYPGLRGNLERRALLDESLPGQLAEMKIELVTWRDLAR